MGDIFAPSQGVFPRNPTKGAALLNLAIDVKRDFGASGSSASTTGTISLSTPTTLTLAAAEDFANGQGISVAGAGASGALLVTSIVSGAGTTTLTLATAAGTAVTGAAVQHDDTAAIQNAINYIVNTLGGGRLLFPAGMYMIGGSLQQPSAYNAQIILPTIPGGPWDETATNPEIVLELVGLQSPATAYPEGGAMNPPTSGAFLYSTITSGSGSVISGPIGTNVWTNMTVIVHNLGFRTQPNPQVTPLQLKQVAGVIIDNVTCDVDVATENVSEPTNYQAWGLALPAGGNGGLAKVRNYYAFGYYVGIASSQHADLDQVFCQNCLIAWYPYGSYNNHPSVVKRLLSQWCPYVIAAPSASGPVSLDSNQGSLAVRVFALDIEDYVATSVWYNPVTHIMDGAHALAGKIVYVRALANSTTNITVVGAEAVQLVNWYSTPQPNFIFNSSAQLGLTGWTASGDTPSSWFPQFGPGFTFAYGNISSTPLASEADLTSEKISFAANQQLALRYEANATMLTAGNVGVRVQAYDSSDTLLATVIDIAAGSTDLAFGVKFGYGTTPTNASYVTVTQYVAAGTTGPYGVGLRRLKLCSLEYLTDYSDEATLANATNQGLLAAALNNPSVTILNGTTAGTVNWVQDLQGTVKRFVANLAGYENTTATAQTITFPVAFTQAAALVVNTSPACSVSTTEFTLPASMTGPVTGLVVVEGI